MKKPVKIHPAESITIRLTDAAFERGIPLPDGLKMRDKREPYYLEKMRLERKFINAMNRLFKRQSAQVELWMNSVFFGRNKAETPEFPEDLLNATDEEIRELLLLLFTGAGYGAARLELELLLGLDYTLTNIEVAAWARAYAGTLVKNIDKTTVNVIRKGLGMFVETPGFTIRDFMNLLPFDERRSMRIAVTEITNAYAEGQKIGAERLKKEYPGVPIYKTWFTNRDDRVCEICAPLHGQSIPMDDMFRVKGIEIEKPAAHVNCRCWIAYSTRMPQSG